MICSSQSEIRLGRNTSNWVECMIHRIMSWIIPRMSSLLLLVQLMPLLLQSRGSRRDSCRYRISSCETSTVIGSTHHLHGGSSVIDWVVVLLVEDRWRRQGRVAVAGAGGSLAVFEWRRRCGCGWWPHGSRRMRWSDSVLARPCAKSKPSPVCCRRSVRSWCRLLLRSCSLNPYWIHLSWSAFLDAMMANKH